MNRNLLFSVLCTVVIISLNFKYSTAQTPDTQPLNKGTIEDQINYMIEKASTYEDYKVIKAWQVFTIKTHVLDTLKSNAKKYEIALTTIALKDSTIDSLKNVLATTNNTLEVTTREKNSVRFFGILMSKIAYNSLMWLIIAGLAFLMVVFFILFRRSNVVTTQTKQSLDELKEEYEQHRKRTLEREAKIERKYLDELLKYKK